MFRYFREHQCSGIFGNTNTSVFRYFREHQYNSVPEFPCLNWVKYTAFCATEYNVFFLCTDSISWSNLRGMSSIFHYWLWNKDYLINVIETAFKFNVCFCFLFCKTKTDGLLQMGIIFSSFEYLDTLIFYSNSRGILQHSYVRFLLASKNNYFFIIRSFIDEKIIYIFFQFFLNP